MLEHGHDQIISFYAENKTGCWLTLFSVMGYTVKDHGQPVSFRSLKYLLNIWFGLFGFLITCYGSEAKSLRKIIEMGYL